MSTTSLIVLVSTVLSAVWVWSGRRLLAGGRFSGVVAYCYAIGSLPVILLSLLITLVFLAKVAPGMFIWFDDDATAAVHMSLQAIFVVPFILPVPLGVFWAWRQILTALERWLLSRRQS